MPSNKFLKIRLSLHSNPTSKKKAPPRSQVPYPRHNSSKQAIGVQAPGKMFSYKGLSTKSMGGGKRSKNTKQQHSAVASCYIFLCGKPDALDTPVSTPCARIIRLDAGALKLELPPSTVSSHVSLFFMSRRARFWVCSPPLWRESLDDRAHGQFVRVLKSYRHMEPEHRDKKFAWEVVCAYLTTHTKFLAQIFEI